MSVCEGEQLLALTFFLAFHFLFLIDKKLYIHGLEGWLSRWGLGSQPKNCIYLQGTVEWYHRGVHLAVTKLVHIASLSPHTLTISSGRHLKFIQLEIFELQTIGSA